MRLKRRLRTALESAACRAGILSRFERDARGGLTILTYHRVLPASECAAYPFPSLAMPQTAFREQMRLLAERFEVVTVSTGVERAAHGRVGDRPLVAVTFDDGYADNASLAAPILAEFGLKATFFLTCGFVLDGRELWFDRAARAGLGAGDEIERLKRLPARERDAVLGGLESHDGAPRGRSVEPLSRPQVLELVRAGHEIGSHTIDHPILTHASDAELEREVSGSRTALEAYLGTAVHGFCYPNGDHDERVRAVVERSGYRWACTTRGGRNHAPLETLSLRRIDVTPARVTDHDGSYSEIAFRSEISLMRQALRGDD